MFNHANIGNESEQQGGNRATQRLTEFRLKGYTRLTGL